MCLLLDDIHPYLVSSLRDYTEFAILLLNLNIEKCLIMGFMSLSKKSIDQIQKMLLAFPEQYATVCTVFRNFVFFLNIPLYQCVFAMAM